MRNKTGRNVPRSTARYAPNWTSRERVCVGRSTIAKAGEEARRTGAAMEADLRKEKFEVVAALEASCERSEPC